MNTHLEHNRGKSAERLVWAVDTLAVVPTDRLLEIGCGHGIAVSLVCKHLDSGSITAIDRSQKMIDLARQRNAGCIAAGKAAFHTMSLAQANFGTARFDKVFAIRVGVLLRGNAARELAVIQECLVPDGRFYLMYDPPRANQVQEVIETATTVLRNHDFVLKEVLTKQIAQTRVVCVIAGQR